MNRIWGSVAFRLALGYGLLAIGSMLVVSTVFYFGTVGVVARRVDAKLQEIGSRLGDQYATHGTAALQRKINELLTDGIDQDTEVYQLIGTDGQVLAGNIAGWTPSRAQSGHLETGDVIRYGQPSVSRLLPQLLPDGAILVVGRDLRDQFNIQQIVWRALAIGAVCSAILALLGALVFRRQVEGRIAAIRRTAHEIGG